MAIKIIGLGPGAADYILPKATDEIRKSDIIVGFQRAIESIAHIHTPKKIINSLKELLGYINDHPGKTIGVIASGDPCFYGILEYIKKNTKEEITVIPGISSFQYLMSQLQKSWHSAYIGSLHGREADFANIVGEYDISVWLTDRTRNVDYICNQLLDEKGDYQITVGENLSYTDEKITTGTAKELENQSYSDLCVVVIENQEK